MGRELGSSLAAIPLPHPLFPPNRARRQRSQAGSDPVQAVTPCRQWPCAGSDPASTASGVDNRSRKGPLAAGPGTASRALLSRTEDIPMSRAAWRDWGRSGIRAQFSSLETARLCSGHSLPPRARLPAQGPARLSLPVPGEDLETPSRPLLSDTPAPLVSSSEARS